MKWLDYVQTDGYLAMVESCRADAKDDKRILILADHIQDAGFDEYAEKIREVFHSDDATIRGRINLYLLREYILPLTPKIEGSCTTKNGFVDTVFPDFKTLISFSTIRKWSVWKALRYTQPFARFTVDPSCHVFGCGYARDLRYHAEAIEWLRKFTGGWIPYLKNPTSYKDSITVVKSIEYTISSYLDKLYDIE